MNPEAPARKRMHPAVKAAIILVLLAGVGVLFVRSVTNVRAEPYEIQRAHLTGWTLSTGMTQDGDGAAIALRPPTELPLSLSRQLFRRQMESLSTPMAPGIALALATELAPATTAEQVLALARESGLDRATLTPRCVGYRRISGTGVTRQLYFVWFSLPEYDAFRERLKPLARQGYTPASLSPVMLAAAEPNVAGWHPVVVDEARDCVAPVTVP